MPVPVRMRDADPKMLPTTVRVSVKVPVAVGENWRVSVVVPLPARVMGAGAAREKGAARPPK